MLILITGVPGSGKSLFAVDLIEKYLSANEVSLKSDIVPRQVYSDIDGLEIEGVLGSPDDWRDAPDGSVVVYDECQQKFGPDGQGRSGRQDIQDLEIHRHRGFDIILITQHPKLLHAHIRRLVGCHYHVFRMHGTQNAKIFQRDGQIDIDKPSQLTQQDSYMWSYPKKHFDKYKSATIHTHKATMPKWLKRGIYAGIIILSIMAFLAPRAIGFFTGDAIAEQINSTIPETNTDFVSNEILITPSNDSSPVACLLMSDKCACYNAGGYKLDIPFQFCKKFTEDTPRYLDFTSKRAERAVAS